MKLTASQMTGLGAGALVYCKATSKILLALRSEHCDAPNTWCCFGGGVERGETIEQGIVREFKEEFSVNLSAPLYPLYVNVICDEDGRPVFEYRNYLAIVDQPFSGKLNNEHSDWGWFSGRDLPQPLHPEFKKALASLPAQALLTSLKGM